MPSTEPQNWITDACGLITLSATGHLEAILRSWRPSASIVFYMAENVKDEALFLRRGGSGDDADERELIDLDALITQGVLHVVKPDTPQELADYVALAAQLDDGEAMTCALAASRGWAVITDDRKALRWLDSQGVTGYGTPDMLHQWSVYNNIDPSELKSVLLRVQDRANFLPPRVHSLKSWWEAVTSI